MEFEIVKHSHQNVEFPSSSAIVSKQAPAGMEFESPGGSYTGRMLIDGEIYTPSEATKKFLQQSS